jgi:hypothetical protein
MTLPFLGFDLITLAETEAPLTPRLPRRVALPSASYFCFAHQCTPPTKLDKNEINRTWPTILLIGIHGMQEVDGLLFEESMI